MNNNYPCPICTRAFYSIQEAQLHALDAHIIRDAQRQIADWCPNDPDCGLHDYAGKKKCACGARNTVLV